MGKLGTEAILKSDVDRFHLVLDLCNGDDLGSTVTSGCRPTCDGGDN